MSSVVVLTSGLVALSILATDPRENGASLGTVARAPAALVGMAFATPETQASVEKAYLLEFGCQPPKVAKIGSNIRQIRLKGDICLRGDKAITTTDIVNLTNGFTATIFNPDETHFSSDYIHLAEGQNRLRYTVQYTDGTSSESEFNVVRE